MLSNLAQRLAGATLVVFGVISIVFLLIHLIPGDPVEIMLGEAASATDREALRIALGLDWLGPLLILVFSLWLGWFPVSGREGLGSVVLPAVTLGTGLAAVLSRMVRSSMLEVPGEDCIRTARTLRASAQPSPWRALHSTRG
jgi:ABC-type dipeptide/oligopeptide/nickel transport system permease component